ncbi:TMEM175 family protein [Paraferrimonas sedimenticola]|uniref:DUF1211 domain-containing protein n=1 Tax=Paraferrimonas sedimenticola TaxID=375674 RepID=A0AA37VZC3_9GAMM|nr:TMEM175 family protein [Paraferrimonas sedimenticola]GLP97601.1 hypothetical protein GCM10007895_29080 [Paraferrimonas sedimenticola]
MLDPVLAKNRLQRLADTVFALSLILLISNVELPAITTTASASELQDILIDNLPEIGVYLLTFTVIAANWVKHVELFSVIKKLDRTLMMQQLWLLAFLMLVPVTNQFISVDDSQTLILVVYSVNLLAVGVMLWLGWRRLAAHEELLIEGLSMDKLRARSADSLSEPLVAALSIAAAFHSSLAWELSFLLVPILFSQRHRLEPLKKRILKR